MNPAERGWVPMHEPAPMLQESSAKRERKMFDEHAGRYDGWFMKNRNVLESEVLLVKLALGRPGRTLSVGCGSGLFESLLRAEHGIEIIHGVEPAEGMAQIAEKRGMSVLRGTAEAVPYGDGEFNTVLMNGTPSYLADVKKAFEEAHRLLHSGGHVVVGDVPANSGYGMLYQLATKIGRWDDPDLKKIAPENPYPIEFASMAHWRTTEELTVNMREVGFVDLEYNQTLTRHPRYTNDSVEQPVPGFDRGGYVVIRGRKK
jgi:ubiquinone/menaquinone biosynthesis C-methylase UbiE